MRHLEDNLQIACVQWFSLQYPRLALLLHHSPNGGKRTKFEAMNFKRMGTRKGFPDLILLVGNGQYNALCVEMKTETGKQSTPQKEWQKSAQEQGNKYIVCRDIYEFKEAIREYFGG